MKDGKRYTGPGKFAAWELRWRIDRLLRVSCQCGRLQDAVIDKGSLAAARQAFFLELVESGWRTLGSVCYCPACVERIAKRRGWSNG